MRSRPPAGYEPVALPEPIPASVPRPTAHLLAGRLTGFGIYVHVRRSRRTWEVYVPARYTTTEVKPCNKP